MLESGSSGSVRGVLSNEHPYREPRLEANIPAAKAARPLLTDTVEKVGRKRA
jgi:hypothetical protein